LRALIEESLASSAALIDKMEALCAARSTEAERAAHELKGLAGTVGAHQLGALAKRGEELARAEQWSELAATVRGLREGHLRLAETVLALGDDIAWSE